MTVIYEGGHYKQSPRNQKIPIIKKSEQTASIYPNKYYIFEEVAELTISLAGEKNDILQEYMFEFVSGDVPTILNLPQEIKWITDNKIQANKTYQVSIVNNLAVMGGA